MFFHLLSRESEKEGVGQCNGIPAVKWMARLGMRATGRSILTSRDSKFPSELRIITRPAMPKSLTEVIEVHREMVHTYQTKCARVLHHKAEYSKLKHQL